MAKRRFDPEKNTDEAESPEKSERQETPEKKDKKEEQDDLDSILDEDEKENPDDKDKPENKEKKESKEGKEGKEGKEEEKEELDQILDEDQEDKEKGQEQDGEKKKKIDSDEEKIGKIREKGSEEDKELADEYLDMKKAHDVRYDPDQDPEYKTAPGEELSAEKQKELDAKRETAAKLKEKSEEQKEAKEKAEVEQLIDETDPAIIVDGKEPKLQQDAGEEPTDPESLKQTWDDDPQEVSDKVSDMENDDRETGARRINWGKDYIEGTEKMTKFEEGDRIVRFSSGDPQTDGGHTFAPEYRDKEKTQKTEIADIEHGYENLSKHTYEVKKPFPAVESKIADQGFNKPDRGEKPNTGEKPGETMETGGKQETTESRREQPDKEEKREPATQYETPMSTAQLLEEGYIVEIDENGNEIAPDDKEKKDQADEGEQEENNGDHPDEKQDHPDDHDE